MRNLLVWSVLAVGGITSPCHAQATLAPAEPPNYAHAPLMHGLMHWAKFPIHVYFTPGPAATSDALKTVRDGFSEWTQASGGVVSYTVVADAVQAELSVTLLPDSFLPGQRGVMGTTTVLYVNEVIKKATMQIAAGDATPEELQTSAAHEFGHALGINGHSSNQDDIMYPSETRIVALDGKPIEMPAHPVSARDINTLKIGYGPFWPPGTAKSAKAPGA